MTMAAIGARMREAREARNLTQEQLARALDVPRSAISDIERGVRGLSASELVAASKSLRRPLDYFVNVEDSPSGSGGEFAVRFRTLSLRPEDEAVVFEFEQCCRA